MLRLTPADRQRVLRLCQHLLANGRWGADTLDDLAKSWPRSEPTAQWRADCADALDRLVGEGDPDPVGTLRRRIEIERERLRSTNGKPIAAHWWFKDGYYLLTRPEDASPARRVELDRVFEEASRRAAERMEGVDDA